MKLFVRIFLSALFVKSQAMGQVISPLLKEHGPSGRAGYEYYVGKDFGKPLITVNLLNGVREPGVYHVPYDTDITKLIAYAGGALQSSDIGEITIRRAKTQKVELLKVDLEKVLKAETGLPSVLDKDIIHIQQKTNIDESIKWVSLVATILSIGVSASLLQSQQK